MTLMRRSTLALTIAAGVLVLLLGIGGGVYLGLNMGSKDETAAPQPAESQTGDSPAAPDSDATEQTPQDPNALSIEAGAGGRDKAKADGETPVGYDSTCAGAVQAATNYTIWALSPQVQWRLDEETYNALIDEINGGLDGGIGPISEWKAQTAENGFFTDKNEGLYAEAHPEWSLFHVEDCVPEHQATIDVGVGADRPATPDEAGMDGGRIYLSWDGHDWRLVDIDADYYYELSEKHSIPFTTPKPTPQSWRDEAKEAFGPGWQEYTNAPKN